MEAEQETQEVIHNEEGTNGDAAQSQSGIEQEEFTVAEETTEDSHEQTSPKNPKLNSRVEDRSSFVHGLAVGLGIGCIATFVIMWITVFFTPLLPTAVTYENLLAIFIYPLLYLLAVGLIALTAGIVREYYTRKGSF
jgi:hypothetical protein